SARVRALYGDDYDYYYTDAFDFW
nr:immunoglobulin heavy chain junction region [Macaca mulatta]MOW32351.1 immunoglobulin heavy chain junction region [Macaca mulatta]MOW32503.1 immunoglobulin heavy chain junction region [Macaca mulatta]MOW32744.1 immunoglobulin heavy chain junction region [Macaca mulatta]MOW32917.1 immunoglobulin heavy chain junction region [Macaca mulatta]